jgi:hypothetical protein
MSRAPTSLTLAALVAPEATAQPRTDTGIRSRYQAQEKKIPAIMAQMNKAGQTAEARARAACTVRREARLRARRCRREAGRPEEVALPEKRWVDAWNKTVGFGHSLANGFKEETAACEAKR